MALTILVKKIENKKKPDISNMKWEESHQVAGKCVAKFGHTFSFNVLMCCPTLGRWVGVLQTLKEHIRSHVGNKPENTLDCSR